MRPASTSPAPTRRQRAISLLEAVILVLVLGIIGVGAGVGLQAAVRVPAAVDDRLTINALLVQRMEEISQISFASLAAGKDDAGIALSDTVLFKGRSLNRTVAVAKIDGDADGVIDPDLLEITVSLNGQTLKTRVCKP
jgi:Tfp pilus assembly protein PilV